MSNLPARPTYTYTEDDWIQIRAHFMGSILVDIHLHKLAQNIGASWPIKAKEETPAKYLEYSFEELGDAPGLAGQPSRLQLLLDILKETAAFDDPFQDMMEGKADPGRPAANTDQLLQKLGVSTDFPIEFTALSEETKELCRSEGAATVGQCVALLQGMAQSVILNGEVRQLLNSLAHTDEQAIANFLPYRPGTRGLHLAESIGIAIRNLPQSQCDACLTPANSAPENVTAATAQLNRQLPALLKWFPAEATQLEEIATSGQSVERFFHPLNNAPLEEAAARAIRQHFAPEPEPEPVAPKPSGFFSRLTGFFRSNR